jgi:hypothetical protein
LIFHLCRFEFTRFQCLHRFNWFPSSSADITGQLRHGFQREQPGSKSSITWRDWLFLDVHIVEKNFERSLRKSPMFDWCSRKSCPIGWSIFLTVQGKPTNLLHRSRYRQYFYRFEEADSAINHLYDRGYCRISVEIRLVKQSDDGSWRLSESMELGWFQGVSGHNVSYMREAEDSDANRDKWQHIRVSEKFIPLLIKHNQRVCLDVTSAASAVMVQTVSLAF